jgi:hypothetical protein
MLILCQFPNCNAHKTTISNNIKWANIIDIQDLKVRKSQISTPNQVFFLSTEIYYQAFSLFSQKAYNPRIKIRQCKYLNTFIFCVQIISATNLIRISGSSGHYLSQYLSRKYYCCINSVSKNTTDMTG